VVNLIFPTWFTGVDNHIYFLTKRSGALLFNAGCNEQVFSKSWKKIWHRSVLSFSRTWKKIWHRSVLSFSRKI